MNDAKRLTIDEAAQIMGMKPDREVKEVVATSAGTVVRTHDGTWSLIDNDGKFRGKVAAPGRRSGVLVELDPEPNYVGEQGPEPVPVADLVPERVRSGSIDVVTDWVNELPDQVPTRAALALAVENAKPAPRSTLVAALEKLKG